MGAAEIRGRRAGSRLANRCRGNSHCHAGCSNAGAGIGNNPAHCHTSFRYSGAIRHPHRAGADSCYACPDCYAGFNYSRAVRHKICAAGCDSRSYSHS